MIVEMLKTTWKGLKSADFLTRSRSVLLSKIENWTQNRLSKSRSKPKITVKTASAEAICTILASSSFLLRSRKNEAR